ncbi:hypothetical protein LEP1GSC058_3092 [Leptospira fainei serovar Hurstbridge str. BUT 6]|uniref:Uncharacterized protein n=1 Tax=Leptospira fainei serovar Hurstbridge str. BUT 6 TaxID=1193011 RepID=S3UVH8_9LEPT|nr:hypothetical protein LEP1GSC058_3092 [Leptospira fainei serovar Hurstbridge str. BUT 6]
MRQDGKGTHGKLRISKRFPTHRYLLGKIRQTKIPTSWYLFLSRIYFPFDQAGLNFRKNEENYV